MEPQVFAFALCSLFAVTLSLGANDNFAFTDKVGQGNFAFAKMFAFSDDGTMYRLTKRSAYEEPRDSFAFAINGIRNKFAKHRQSQGNDAGFAFAKRSNAFAKRFAFNGDNFEWEEVDSTKPEFAKFAKRSAFALAPGKLPLFA